MNVALRLFFATSLAWAGVSSSTAQTQGPQTFHDGVFTAEQAARGERLYAQHCSLCHGDNLLGIEMAPPLAGPNFMSVWENQPLIILASRIKTTMPPQAANSLLSAETVDIVSYILETNGLTSGDAALSLSLSDAPLTASSGDDAGQWPTYGRNLASHRYSPLDQINKDNFADLQVAWRLGTNNLGPYPERLFSATPLMVDGVLYTTAGTGRSVVALNPGTGQMLWMYYLDEGVRGQFAPRRGSGRGVSYWEGPDGSDKRILFVTPGYQLIALDAETGRPVESFGNRGVVDLKLDNDQDLDLERSVVGLNAPPLVAGDVVVVGAAHSAAGNPRRSTPTAIGYVRGFDVRTGKRLWIFHTIPRKGEFGYDTWEDGSAERNGNLGAWAQLSADLELGLVYVPMEMPAADYYGIHRPGDNLFAESLAALDIKTGERKWHYQTIHHGLWDWDLPCAPILYEMVKDGRTIKALAQPTKSAFLFVLNRETGEPIWPIEERPVPQSDVPTKRRARRNRSRPSRRRLTDKACPSTTSSISRRRYGLKRSSSSSNSRSGRCLRRRRWPAQRPPGNSHPPGRRRRRQLARRLVRSRNRPSLHSLAHQRVYSAQRSGRAGDAPRPGQQSGRVAPRRRGRRAPSQFRRHATQPGRDEKVSLSPSEHDGPRAAAHQASVRPYHGVRHDERRDLVAEDAQLDAG